MPSTDKELLIRVRADIQQALRELKKLPKEIGGINQSSARSAKNIDGMGRGFQFLTRAAGAYLSLRLVTKLVQQADAINVLNTRIKTATKSTGDYATVQKQLFDITQQNGQSFDITVSLFQSLARSAPELQATNKEVLKLVNLVQQLGVISGASQSAQRAGLLQFSQGLASGVFRAEEFNSLLENIPEVASRIAKGLGVSVGQLRAMVLDGKLLSRDVFDALVKQSGEINKEFESIPDSVGRATERFGNAFSKWLSDIDKSVGLTKTLVDLLNSASSVLSGNVRPVKEIRAEIEQINKSIVRAESSADRRSGVRSGRRNAASAELLRKRLAELRDELNQAVIDAGGPTGIRVAMQVVEQEIEKQEARLIEHARGHNRIINQQIRKRVADLRQQLGELEKQLVDAELSFSSDNEKTTTTPTSGGKDQEGIDKFIAKLREQNETLNLSGEALVVYQLKQLGASQQEIVTAKAIAATIAARQQHDEVLAEGQRIIDQTRTAEEKLALTKQKLNRLYQAGAFGAIGSAQALETLKRAIAQAQEEYDKFKNQGEDGFDRLAAATRGWGEQFTKTLTDMVQQGKLDFSSLADSIINDLLRIAVYQGITEPLFGSLGIPGFAEVKHSGGVAGSGGGARRAVNPLLFAAAPRYHNGGFAGLRPGEVPAILQSGELVLSKEQLRNRAAGGNTRVEIVNRGAPARVTDANTRLDADGLVVQVVLDDLQTGGPIRDSVKSLVKS